MVGKKLRGKRGKRSNNPPNTTPPPPKDGTNVQAETSSRNSQPQSSQTDAAISRASSQFSSPTTSPSNRFQSAPKTQGHEKITTSVLIDHAVDASSPGTAESSKPRMVLGKLGPERLMLRHNASSVSLRRDYLLHNSLPETVKQRWEKGDSGGGEGGGGGGGGEEEEEEEEEEKDVSTGSKWVREGSGERDDVEKALAESEGLDIGLGIMGMASDPEEDIYATKYYNAPSLHSTYQCSPSRALDRGYLSLSYQVSSPHCPSTPPSPSSRVLPTHMSAFEYAIRPFLDNSPMHQDHHLVLSSPTTASFTSSEPSVPANLPSAAQSSWSHWMEQTYEAPPPERSLPEFLKGANTLENRLRHLTLTIALLRCTILVRLIQTSHSNDINPYNPVNSPDRFRIPSTSRGRSKSKSRPRAASNTHRRLRFPHSYLDVSDSDIDDDVKTENYQAWSKFHTLAYRIAYPVAQKLGHQGLQARCLYWVGRAEWGLGNWENAAKAFERVGFYGATDLRSDEKDWEFWLQKVRTKDVDDEGLGIDMNDEQDDDGDEEQEQEQEEDQKRDFEDWEWEYITHGVLPKYKAALRRKHRQIREQAIPEILTPSSHRLSPSSAWSLADRYQEHAFSPWDRILGGGGEVSPPRENLGDITEKEGEREGEGTGIGDSSLASPRAKGDGQPSKIGIEET